MKEKKFFSDGNSIGSFLGRMKISSRLTLVYSTLVSLILLIFTSCTIFSVYIYSNLQSSRVLISTATAVTNSITQKQHLFENNWDDITIENDLYIVIYSEHGQILRKPDSLDASDALIEDGNLEQFNKVFRRAFFDDAAYINRSIMLDDEVFIIQVIKDHRSELRMLTVLAITLLSLLLVGAICAVFIGRKMSAQLLKPIGIMTENANNIQLNGVSCERLQLSRQKDEINDLGNTINAMLDRIENYSKTLTQFVSDASHELRTPITVVLAYSEMLKKWAKTDPVALEKSIDCIAREALGMKVLVDRLLTLAKSDTKNLALNCAPFELSQLIEDIFEETTLLAGERKLNLLQNDALLLNSDSHRFKELLRILIDNAIKYTDNEGAINISSSVCDQQLCITVEDNGLGIKKEDLPKIFDRFFCCESSRNKKKSGSGLGLSIAKALANELLLQIEVQSQEGQYTRFLLKKDLANLN